MPEAYIERFPDSLCAGFAGARLKEVSPRAIAPRYVSATGEFRPSSSTWKDYNTPGLYASFRELRVGDRHVFITDGIQPDWKGCDFIVRIPGCGGTVSWSWSPPIAWLAAGG